MATPNKQHHYVPAGYLRTFAAIGRKNRPRLSVLDLETGEWRKQSPAKVCRENHFYWVESPELDGNAIEVGVLQRLETDAIPIFRRLERECSQVHAGKQAIPRFPSAEEESAIKAFVAMMFLRTKLARTNIDELAAHMAREMVRRGIASDRETYEKFSREFRTANPDADELSFEDMRRVTESDDFRIGADRTFAVGTMLNTWRDVYSALSHRSLVLHVPTRRAGLFVASDCPVAVCLGGPTRLEVYQADIRQPETKLTMPVGPHVFLRLDADAEPHVAISDRIDVAMSNSLTVMPDRSLVLAKTESFEWFDGDQICGPDALVGFVRNPTEDSASLRTAAIRKRVATMLEETRQAK